MHDSSFKKKRKKENKEMNFSSIKMKKKKKLMIDCAPVEFLRWNPPK